MVLELKPFSMANKDNSARDPMIWNQLWGLVSSQSVDSVLIGS
jgi:hypothetical protein